MTSDKPSTNVLRFERPRRFPDDLDRLRAQLDDEESVYAESDLDDALALTDAAITRGVPGGLEAKADVSNIRAHRTLHAGDADAAFAAWGAILGWHPTYLNAYKARADILVKRGDHDAARAELDRFIALAPTDARGYMHRANLYKEQGDGERALANFRRVVQLDPEAYEAHLSMAHLLAAKGDANGAARAYAKHAEQELGDAQSYGFRGLLFFLAGHDDLALADYEAAVALTPNDPDALAWRALCRSRLGRVDAAITDYTRLIAMTPTEARGYWRRGEVLERAGKHAEALVDLERAIAIGGDERGAAHFARGMAQHALGDVAAALASFDIAIERDPSNVACRVRRFQIHDEAEDWAACQIDVEAVLVQRPDDTTVLHTHARLCVRLDRRDDALAAYDRLIALEPNNAVAYFERYERRTGKGDTRGAYADLDRAFELAPEELDIRAAYGRKQVQGAKTDEERAAAIQMIVSSVKLDPADPETFALLSWRLRDAQCYAEGLPYVTRAIELSPDKAEYYEARASCLQCAAPLHATDPEGYDATIVAALADIERAIALSINDDDVVDRYGSRAELREETDDFEGALADYTKMIEINPEFYDPYVARARLRKQLGDMPGALADAAKAAAMEDETIAMLVAHGHSPDLERFNLDEA